MTAPRLIVVAALASVLWVGSPASTAEKVPATKPAAEAKVPESVFKDMAKQFELPVPRGLSRAKAMELFRGRMKQVIRIGREAEKSYPKAADLHKVRRDMLRAADFIVRRLGDESYAKHRLIIARRLLASKAPAEAKVQADWFVTQEKITGKAVTFEQQGKEIRAYAKRYDKTPAEGPALAYAAMLAIDNVQFNALQDCVAKLRAKHAKDTAIRRFLEGIARIGKPFEAALTTIDGKKLSLPGGLKGKVLVIDFWAIWCRPCITELPNMRKAYAEYKPKGVEFVGISLDRPNNLDKLKAFVKKEKLNWVHCYSGKYWDDPTVKKYGIRGIPSIWVVGKGGRIVSDSARGRLEAVLDKALKAPAPKKG